MGCMSARMIGRELGCMTAQEVNMLLCEEGYLEGEPGDYTVTEKGAPYAEEHDYHRGTGGYATYNRHWSTRSWDDGILDAIGDVSPERRRELAEKVAKHRDEAHRRNFGLDDPADDGEEDEYASAVNENDDFIDGKTTAIAIGAIAGGILIWKGARVVKPYVQKWWSETAQPWLSTTKKIAAKFGKELPKTSGKDEGERSESGDE